MNPPAPTASAAALPFKAADDTAVPVGAPWGAALLVCAAVAALVAGALKRRRGATPWRRDAGLVEVVERRSLTTHTHLVVTRYAGRRLLLSVGPAGTQCLRDDPEGDLP